MKLPYLFKRSGKNIKLFYYARCMMFYLTPKILLRKRLPSLLASAARRSDWEQIADRVDYCCKLDRFAPLPESSPTLGRHRLKGCKSVYFFDSFEYTRWFPDNLRWSYVFGDVIHVPELPSIVKSRPLTPDNENSTLLNMDKVRHFCFLEDTLTFAQKQNRIIFRGDAWQKPRRQQFISMYKDHPMCDIADVAPQAVDAKEHMMTLREHLDYKFIMALEGNDVASNLKWVMSSNSIAVMPRPTCETWFMEGRLIPDYHYIEIRPDHSDLIERVTYYIEHPELAQQIIDNAHRYVEQFRNRRRERIVSLLVMKKYFEHTNEERR